MAAALAVLDSSAYAPLSKDPDVRVGDVMELGPKTLRPSHPVEKLLESRANDGVKHWVVTTSHGKFLGLLSRTDAETALATG